MRIGVFRAGPRHECMSERVAQLERSAAARRAMVDEMHRMCCGRLPEVAEAAEQIGDIVPTSHMADWIRCMNERATPIADVESHHLANPACRLAMIAMRAGRPLRWTPAAPRPWGDDEEAARLLVRRGRAPYALPTDSSRACAPSLNGKSRRPQRSIPTWCQAVAVRREVDDGVAGMAWRVWIVGRRPARTLLRAAVLGVATAVIVRWVVRPFRVTGTSMEPTVPDGAWGLGVVAAYRGGEPRVGDIVMIRLAGDSVMYLKRVLAVPGETVEFRNGQLWVNGERRPEPYLRESGDWTSAPVVLGPGEYMVAGDRRNVRQSAHLAGVVRRERIVGRLWTWTGGQRDVR